jgi:hypothetical protein
MKTFVQALCAASLLLLPGLAQAAQYTVVEARGIGFAPGANIDATKPMVLREGQHVTLITPAGATINLDGPYNQAPDTGQGHGVALTTKLASLVSGGQRFGEVGTTRGTATVKLPSAWVLDVSRSGTVCLLDDGHPAVLWRPASAAETGIVVTPDDRSWRVNLQWPARTDQLALGSDVPLRAGTTYFVALNGDQWAITVDLVPAGLATDAMRAAWMANKGCEAQAEAMLRSAK